MILRKALPADARAIAAIMAHWVDETEWMPQVHSGAERRGFGALLVEHTEVTVAEERGQVLGFLARREGRIEALYIARTARGRGVGRALVGRAMRAGPELRLWCHQANGRALRFYAGLGFTEVQRTDGAGNDEGLPDVQMVWQREARR